MPRLRVDDLPVDKIEGETSGLSYHSDVRLAQTVVSPARTDGSALSEVGEIIDVNEDEEIEIACRGGFRATAVTTHEEITSGQQTKFT